MTKYLEEPFEPGNPDHVGYYPGEKKPKKRYVGVDKPKVLIKPPVTGRGEGYPWARDLIDYDPRFDEDLEDNNL